MEEKIQYIYRTINKGEINTNNIFNFINKNNLKYSENNNGILLNLSRLDEDIINKLCVIVEEDNLKFINLDLNNKLMVDLKSKITINRDKQLNKSTIEETKKYTGEGTNNFEKISINKIESFIIQLSKTPLIFT